MYVRVRFFSPPVASVEMRQATALISFVCLCVVCAQCAHYQHARTGKHMAPRGVFLAGPEACLADSHSIVEGRKGGWGERLTAAAV